MYFLIFREQEQQQKRLNSLRKIFVLWETWTPYNKHSVLPEDEDRKGFVVALVLPSLPGVQSVFAGVTFHHGSHGENTLFLRMGKSHG